MKTAICKPKTEDVKTVSDKNTIRKINANLTQFKKKEKR